MLGHPHGIEQRHRFHLSLIRDPRFASLVNDIVEECGNARFQDRIDRFVAGKDVPDAELRRVWEDTISAAPNCDLPMYEDVPIVWEDVKAFDDIVQWDEQRFGHMADVVRREVVAKGRRAPVRIAPT